MACEKQVGVRNIIMKITDCDTGTIYGPVAHELAGDDQPMYKLCPYNNEPLPGGYVKRNVANSEIAVSVIRHQGIPLAMYQGCGAIDITIEHFNGRVVTGINGTATGDESSDGHEVAVAITYSEVDELLPTQLDPSAV